jgi:hypothetical protein
MGGGSFENITRVVGSGGVLVAFFWKKGALVRSYGAWFWGHECFSRAGISYAHSFIHVVVYSPCRSLVVPLSMHTCTSASRKV